MPPLQYSRTHTHILTYGNTHLPLQRVADFSEVKLLVPVSLLLRALKEYVLPSMRSEKRDGSGVSYEFIFRGEEEGQ